MDIGPMLKSLQDPMGIPFYPIVFQVLLVLTFALHILFVNFALGTSFFALYGYFKGDGYWRRLSGTLARVSTANISMAMLLGVAPLLFVQVVYDPFWYTSNVLSAAWVIGFVFIMMAAYGSLYLFYLGRRSEAGKGPGIFGVVAVALFVVAGIIMHALGYQLLQPEKWYQWYINGGSVDASGTSLHAFQLPRFLHFIVPSFAMAGVFMMLYGWYFSKREDMDAQYLSWVARTGANMAFLFTAIQACVGVWWLLVLPDEFAFLKNPFFLVGAALGVCLLFLLYFATKDPLKFAAPSGLGAFLTILGMSLAREVLRMHYVGRFDYSIFQYKLNIDWGSTLLFIATFLMGLVIISYLLSVAYKAGKVKGEYVASASMQKLGNVTLGLMIAWILVVAGLGIVISVKNYLL
jgi:hypothetical protein